MFFVYRFIDKTGSVIYVGKSKLELQKRFAAHNHLPDECYKLVKKVEYIECKTESDMSIKEIYYINKYRNNPVFFNILDVTDLPTSIVFEDKWKKYKDALPPNFCNSINFKKGYSITREKKYNLDGTISKRRPNSEKGVSTYVEGLTSDEIDLICSYLITQINSAENRNQEQIRFRNLVMFVLACNIPHKANEILSFKYGDLFDEKDRPKSLNVDLGRYTTAKEVLIPLRNVVKNVLISYTRKYQFSYKTDKDTYLFQSRVGNNPISGHAWWKTVNDAVTAVKIEKNVGMESIRKSYGLNIYSNAINQLNALVFLGEIWGSGRDTKIIKYLNLTETDIDFDYYLGETFSLCDVDISRINCVTGTTNTVMSKNTLTSTNVLSDSENHSAKQKRKKRNKPWSKEEKLEVVNKYKEYGTFKALGAAYGLDPMLVSRWVKTFREYGEAAFDD